MGRIKLAASTVARCGARFVLMGLSISALPSAAHAATTTSNANCRVSLSPSARSIEHIPAGTSVAVLSREGSWAKVDRRRDCWISDRYLTAAGPAIPERSLRSYKASARRSSGRLETRRANRRSLRSVSRRSSPRRSLRSSSPYSYDGGSCPCSGHNICIGPRGGRYCMTSGGNKRYGV